VFYFPNKPIRIYDPQRFVGNLKPVGDWVAQPKWDGKRAMVSCDDHGQVSLSSREGRSWPKENWGWLVELKLPRPWFLDTELLRDGRIFVWDFAVLGGKALYREAYRSRLEILKGLAPCVKGSQSIEVIESVEAVSYQTLTARAGQASLEGVVWKNLNATDLWGPHSTTEVASQFKFRFK
jgi:ATP-dependent DNA ligase